MTIVKDFKNYKITIATVIYVIYDEKGGLYIT
jgi:hypothetical protein